MIQKDVPFPSNNKFFVPDKRCPGWYTTNIVGFTGFHEGISLESSQNAHKLLTRNVQDFLNIYYRYRIYINDEGILIFSVRQEDVSKISEELYNFRLQVPKPKDFECVKIAIENAPFYRNLMDEFTDMMHNYDLKKDLAPKTRSKQEIARLHYVAHMVNSNRERVFLEFHKQEDKDMFIKNFIRNMFQEPCKCKVDCMWNSYQNIWTFQDMLEQLGSRTEKQKRSDFGPLFIMTKKIFDKRKSGNGRDAYLKALDNHIGEYKFTDSDKSVIVNETKDNMPIPNIDVIRGRGLWLSHSRTYANWPTEVVKEGTPKLEEPDRSQEELLEEVLKKNRENKTEKSEENEAGSTENDSLSHANRSQVQEFENDKSVASKSLTAS